MRQMPTSGLQFGFEVKKGASGPLLLDPRVRMWTGISSHGFN